MYDSVKRFDPTLSGAGHAVAAQAARSATDSDNPEAIFTRQRPKIC
jgi:hypothetical protein